MNEQLLNLAREVGARLAARGEWLATAESCTGGLIAAAVTEIAGSSGWFGYGFVTYSNEAKQDLLCVPAASLGLHGAVSEHVVREMAAGACRRAGAQWSVAVSGIAGPGGGSEAKPVGTVWFGLCGPDGLAQAFVRHFDGDRGAVRQQTAIEALTVLLWHLERRQALA
ncbi:nicotinamide-nucleotide amidohydrolase family protein [uncultured Aquitalea sp.]|uniref:CinA family protein n=1 Tax=uncultured Aquitalea sp. TaxID=540272 RepID=UPI0025F1DD9C|nr:nicotinamide-nucleotide amidohydrolase family protein [uncultured Aquitalea sp.]